MGKVTSEMVKEYLSRGAEWAGDALRDAYRRNIDEAEEAAFCEGIEIGISNTIKVLLEANIKDDQIIQLLNKYWGIVYDESVNRLAFEKQRMMVSELKEYMLLQAWTNEAVDDYIRENRVSMKIRRNPKLMQYKGKPDKLMKAIENID